jgi:hypothetical protein
MPVFRCPPDARHGQLSFFDTLTSHLRELVAPVKISLHRLSKQSSDERYGEDCARTDLLLVFEGQAVAAVEFRAESSGRDATYCAVGAYEGVAGNEGNLNSMAERLQAQLREGMPPVEEKAPEEPQLRELIWHINLRAPGQAPAAWTGGPFDIDKAEAAFEAIVKTILVRAKA